MKKKFLLLFFVLACLCTSCHYGKTNDIITVIENSERFDEKEIEDAISEVKKEFKLFSDCNMTKVWYDECLSEQYAEKYTKDEMERNNVILVLCDFNTGSNCPAGLKENSVYRNYQWLLVREEKNEKWHIEENGY